MAKKILFTLYILVLLSMGAATIVEQGHGTDYAHSAVYGAWWFTVLWALLTAISVFYFLRRKVKAASTWVLHLSFVVILAGALITHLTARRGMVHLRLGETVGTYYSQDNSQGNSKEGTKVETLPFSMKLTNFAVIYHDGTKAAADYESHFVVKDGEKDTEGHVSMNNIFSYKGYRFYQASYDEDGKGSVLSINADPWGIPLTYVGYALLFVSLFWMLIDPKGGYRKIVSSSALKKGALTLALLLSFGQTTHAASVLPKETAAKFGKLNILYNDRICPLQTFAIDFTKKVYGARTYKGLTAEQVLTGWIFYGDEWANEPCIKVKGSELKKLLALSDYCTLNQFFNQTTGYVIGPYVQDFYNGNQDKLHQQAADTDNKLQLIMELRHGTLLKIFPYTFTQDVRHTKTEAAIRKGMTVWYAPTDKLPAAVEKQHAQYIKIVFSLINDDVIMQNYDRVGEFAERMKRYQDTNAGKSLPSSLQVKAERLNNAVPFATILFIVNLTLGFTALFHTIYRLTKRRTVKVLDRALPTLLALSFAALTAALAIRWIISGNVPMSNGYETMLVVAWFVEVISLMLMSKIRIVLVFGFLLSGFFLLVSHINQMDPAIGQMMPVLNSPLLSIHVSIIMMSYALLSLTFICSLMGLCLRPHGKELQALSLLFLYPAITTLGLGIFIGAIWANVSWGTYWSWDPKETWALITMMVYAVALHRESIPLLRKDLYFHLFMVVAFLAVLMTYFGVNFFMSGMHSYA